MQALLIMREADFGRTDHGRFQAPAFGAQIGSPGAPDREHVAETATPTYQNSALLRRV